MDKQKLLELAERVERLSGPCRDVDALIRCALFAGPSAYVEQSKINAAWCVYEIGYNGKPHIWEGRGLPAVVRNGAFTASLDASMTLVPEDQFWRVGHNHDDPSYFTAQASYSTSPSLIGFCMGDGETPALALTAASLRAKAAMIEDE